MKRLAPIFTFLILTITLSAQFPSFVKKIDCKPNHITIEKGNLAQGKTMQDLSWAWKSSVACLPQTQRTKFIGNHVLYSTVIPPLSKMYITVTPDNASQNLSIYAYTIATGNYQVVPNLSSCISCEADYKWDNPKNGMIQDSKRSVYLNSINDPYNIVIGIVGANGLKAGSYTLEIKVEAGTNSNDISQTEIKAITVNVEKDTTISVRGNLNQGVRINNLSWAWQSPVACFPSTQQNKFTGNNVVYSTLLSENSEMEITVIPDNPRSDFSLFAYSTGLNNNSIIPNLFSCVSCEADYKLDYYKKGETQDYTRSVKLNANNNPYKVIIGVVGSKGLATGSYSLKIATKSR